MARVPEKLRARRDARDLVTDHTRRRRHRRRAAAAATVLLGAMAVFVASALGVLSGSPSLFESGDGDMVVGTIGQSDWASVTASSNYLHLPDSTTSTDDSFTSGQKQDTTCPSISPHGNPPKDDFSDVARFTDVNGIGHTFLYGATIRVAANGNASENVELKQGTGGLCAGSTTLLQRVAGDKLIAIDYTGGGASANFHILTWVTSGACAVSNDTAPCWGATVETLAANAAEGEASQAAITAANNPINGTALVAGQFAEFGIDLSAGTNPIVPVGSCSPFAQTLWESRAAGSSFTSATKDVVSDNIGFSNCGEVKIVKHTAPRNIDKDFPFTSNLPANANAGGDCGGIAAGGGFCLNDKSATADTVDAKNLPQGAYTIAEGADPAGFAFDSVSCTPSAHVTVSAKQVSIALEPNDVITCTYVNNQQTGAIKITKTSSKTAATPLAGAHFSVCTNDGPYTAANPCAPAKTGSGDVTTGADGTVCVDGLTLGDYHVTEKSPPTGYARDDTSTSTITVDNAAKCSDASYAGEAKTYTDTPLTDVTVNVASQVAGATKSAVRCTDAGAADVGNSPRPAGADLNNTATFADPVALTATGLRPGTYTCTIVIDP